MVRTLSTASQVAQVMGIPKVLINYRCIEFVNDLVYKNGNPIPRLVWFNKKVEEMEEEYNLQQTEFVDTNVFKEECKELFPEDANKL